MYDEKIYVNAFQRFLLKFKFFIVIISTFLSKKCNSVIRSYDLEETDKTIIYIYVIYLLVTCSGWCYFKMFCLMLLSLNA